MVKTDRDAVSAVLCPSCRPARHPNTAASPAPACGRWLLLPARGRGSHSEVFRTLVSICVSPHVFSVIRNGRHVFCAQKCLGLGDCRGDAIPVHILATGLVKAANDA